MGIRTFEIDKQKIFDFLEECCADTYIGDMLNGEVRVSSIGAQVGVPMMDEHLHHEIEITVCLDVRRKS